MTCPRLSRHNIGIAFPVILNATLGLTGIGVSPPAVLHAQERTSTPAMIPGQPYHAFTTSDSLGRTIRYYLSEQPDRNDLPLLLYIQGSGAGSLFRESADGRVSGAMGHNTVRDVFEGAARVLLVEKPGVAYLDDPVSVESAASAFHIEHTLDRWAHALRVAMRDACSRTDLDCSRGVIVIGHSEGGVVAARVALSLPAVTHVAMLAGEGPTQLYSLLVLAREGVFFQRAGETPESRIDYLLREWRGVLANPDAHDRFFFGHPYRRWSSFLSTSPLRELEGTQARIFIAQGTADLAVSPESADVLFASLTSIGKDVCYTRQEGADHSFSRPDRDGWMEVMEQVRAWFLGQSGAWSCSSLS